MMRLIPFFFLFCLACLCLLTQTAASQRLNWEVIDENQSHFGFIGYHGGRKNVCTDRLGNVVYCAPFGNKVHVSGQELTANYETEITKRNKDGVLIWTKTLGGNGFKFGHSVSTDSVGNIYLLGWYYGNSSINGTNLYSYGNYDCFIVKLSSSGVFQYVRTFGSAGYDYPFGVEVDVLGNAYIAGKFSFSLQAGSSTLSGLSNSHFLLKLNSSGNVDYLRNICSNGSGDWGKGDLSAGRNGKLYVASTFQATSTFDTRILSTAGLSGYVAIINPANGSIETVAKAGTEAWLIDHDLSGQLLVVGLQTSSNDSLGGTRMPALTSTNSLFLARLDNSAQLISQNRYSSFGASFQNVENFRTLHVARSGQIYLSGDLINNIYSATDSVILRAPYSSNKTQAVLIKLEDDLSQSWFVSAGSEDTLNVPNDDFGCGVTTDLEGNVFWSTFNFANSVNSTRLYLNEDTAVAGALSSRYKANGIHLWNLSEPYVNTLNTSALAYCPGDSIEISYLKYGIFEPGNQFTAQLSDSSGSFASPIIIGSIVDTTSGTIKGLLPFALPPGSNYRFRVNADMPEIRGSQTDKVVQMRSKPIADAGPDPLFCLGDTFPLLASGGGDYTWASDTFLIAGDSALALAFPPTDRSFIVRVQDSLSSCFNYDTVYTTYRRKAKVEPMSDTLVCYKSNFIRSAIFSEGDSSRMTYAWYDSVWTLLSTDSFVSFIPYKDEKIILIVWDSCSVLRDTQSFYLKVREPLKVKHITAQDTLICQNAIFDFYPGIMGGDSTSYSWQWMDSIFANVLSLDSNYNRPISYPRQISFRVSDGCSGLDDSISFRVKVSDPPIIETLDSARLCSGDTANLHITYSGGFPDNTLISWDALPEDTAQSYQKAFNGTSLIPVVVRDVCGLKDSANSLITVRQALALQLRSDTVICQGDSILTFVSGSESDTAYYDFFWNEELTPKNYYYSYPTQSSYSTVRIRNNCDLSEVMDSVYLEVRDSLKLNLVYSSNICYGESVKIDAFPQGGLPANWQVDWFDANQVLVHTGFDFTQSVFDSLKMTVVLRDACSSIEDTVALTIYTSPAIQWQTQTDTLLCYGQNFILSSKALGGNGSPIFWKYSSRDSSSLINGFSALSQERIEIIASDNCSLDDTLIFEINLRDPLSVDLLEDTILCSGSELTLEPIISGGLNSQYAFTWQGQMMNPKLVVPEINLDTVFHYCLSDACSQSICDSVVVTLYPMNLAVILGDTSTCAPGLFSLEAAYKDIGQFSSWNWILSNGFDTTSASPTIDLTIVNPGTYTIQLVQTDINSCVSYSELKNLFAFPRPQARFVVNENQFDLDQILMVTTNDQSITEFKWSGLPEIETIITGNYDITLKDTGYYTIKLLAKNKWSCLDSFTQEIFIKEPFTCWIPNAFFPDNIVRNKQFYPVCTDQASYVLKIYNRWGQLMYEGNELDAGWNGTYLNSVDPAEIGVYVYTLTASNNFGEVIQKKGNITILR